MFATSDIILVEGLVMIKRLSGGTISRVVMPVVSVPLNSAAVMALFNTVNELGVPSDDMSMGGGGASNSSAG